MRTVIMRAIGVLNLLFGLASAYYSYWIIRWNWHRWFGPLVPWEWLVFFLLIAISAYLVIAVAYLGIRLLRNDETALRPLRNIFIIEIVYFWLGVVVFWNIMPLSMGEIGVGFTGIAQSPINPQVASGYSVIGAIATAILWRTRKKHPPYGAPPDTILSAS